MSVIRWLDRKAVEAIHAEQLLQHGGLAGIKDENALEASLARAKNKAAYAEPDLFDLAAAYLYAIVRNHPFSDGNKRTGFLAAYTFLFIHGHVIETNDANVVQFVLDVAAGLIDEENAARWLRDFSVRRP